MKTFRYGILPFLIVLGVISGLMVLEPHLSGTILILTIGIVMMFVGGVDLKWFVLGVEMCIRDRHTADQIRCTTVLLSSLFPQ